MSKHVCDNLETHIHVGDTIYFTEDVDCLIMKLTTLQAELAESKDGYEEELRKVNHALNAAQAENERFKDGFRELTCRMTTHPEGWEGLCSCFECVESEQ